MLMNLKVIGAFSETRRIPAGEPISCIIQWRSEGINRFGYVCLLLMKTVFQNKILQTWQTILIRKKRFWNPDHGFVTQRLHFFHSDR